MEIAAYRRKIQSALEKEGRVYRRRRIGKMSRPERINSTQETEKYTLRIMKLGGVP